MNLKFKYGLPFLEVVLDFVARLKSRNAFFNLLIFCNNYGIIVVE
jgi:translation elongation factor EF-4